MPTQSSTGAASAVPQYALQGPQVEPDSGYWIRCPAPCPVSLDALRDITDREKNADGSPNPDYFPPYPTDPKTLDCEIAELQALEGLRDEPYRIEGTVKGRERLPLSFFLHLRPQPVGATVNTARGREFPVILTGRELSRYFENETPGLAHRLALDFMIRNAPRPLCDADLSPTRQARIWAALDVAIFSALEAAWHYKWLATDKAGNPRPQVARRQRPIEYAIDHNLELNVLFDHTPNSTFSADDGRRTIPAPSPGTPRHPAYPSGHSTYSGAGSELLAYFFPQYKEELDRLADNIGLARLWAGIHWRSDHVQGQKLGRVVARLVIAQLVASGVPEFYLPPDVPPPVDELEKKAQEFQKNCGKGTPQPRPCCPCPPCETKPVPNEVR